MNKYTRCADSNSYHICCTTLTVDGLPVRHLEFEKEIADHPLVQSAQEAFPPLVRRLGHRGHHLGEGSGVLVTAAERLSSLETQRQLIDAIFSGDSLP